MNPFSYMASTLAATPAVAPSVPSQASGLTRTQAMRDALASGRQTAAQLGRVAGISSARVGALLKHDLSRGFIRTERQAGITYYVLVDQTLVELVKQLDAAKQLLVRHGYTVIDPIHHARNHS